MTVILRSWLVLLCLALAAPALAELKYNEAIIPARKLPAPHVSQKSVFLGVPHMRQKPYLCVPTSGAMVLAYYGDKHRPTDLKALAEGHKPKNQRNRYFTYWVDMSYALKQKGYRWRIRSYAKTNSGFASGLNAIKASLRKKQPVLIEVHLGEGHTFVVEGFDDAQQIVYVRDPDIAKSRARALSYAKLKEDWHNHKFAGGRSAFFILPK
jgi:hypothetical protein